MTKADLAEFQSEWTDPISTNYHGYDVFELPPPGQGFARSEMLNILEVCVPKFGTSLAALGPSDPQYWHLHGRGEEAGVFGSAGEERRPEVRQRAGQEAAVEGARRVAVRPDRSERRVEAGGHGRHRRRHDLSDDRRSLGQHGVAHPQRVQRLRQPGHGRAVRLRAPQSRRRVLARPGEPEHRRAAQASVPHHHRRLRDEGRRSR